MQAAGTTAFRTVAALAGALAISGTANADAVADFFKGKTIQVIVNAGEGGVNGLYARTVAEHLGRHIPGSPSLIVQFVPGSGGTRGANHCYNVVPRDGSALCHLLMATAHAQMLGATGVRYDASKFTWIGRTATANSGAYVWHTEPVKTLHDLRQHEVVIGATGKGSESYTDPTIINAVLGTKFKVILGYRGGGDLDLALERLEIKGQSGPLISVITRKPHWLEKKLVRYLFQSGLEPHPHPALKGVPLLTSFARNDEERQIFQFMSSRADIGRTYSGPPGIPADRTAALRKSFMDTMKDPKFLAEARKRKIDVMPAMHEEVEKRIAAVLNTPKNVIARTKAALGLK